MAVAPLRGRAEAPEPPPRRLSWFDPNVRAIVYQVLVMGAVLFVAYYLISNTLANLSERRIATGFGFLNREAGFGIGEGLMEYSPADTYFRALIVGLLNTLRIAILGIVFSTIIGTIIGIARLSGNWLIAKLASVYVEIIRNIPLLLQLFFWYAMITENLPLAREAWEPVSGVFLSNRGFRFPVPVFDAAWAAVGIAFIVGAIAAFFVHRWARRRQDKTGQGFPSLWAAAGLILGLPLLVYLLAGAPSDFDVPELRGFNFEGGTNFSPEFAALLIGLVTYTAAFIAEIVRSGIVAVSHGQGEAAMSLGLRRSLALRLVILPQALRLIVPPMTSQYLNLTKNSSLAVAIGYPDIVSIANTTLNQTGQAIEGVTIIMGVYLTISLLISAFMNWYNRRIALMER